MVKMEVWLRFDSATRWGFDEVPVVVFAWQWMLIFSFAMLAG